MAHTCLAALNSIDGFHDFACCRKPCMMQHTPSRPQRYCCTWTGTESQASCPTACNIRLQRRCAMAGGLCACCMGGLLAERVHTYDGTCCCCWSMAHMPCDKSQTCSCNCSQGSRMRCCQRFKFPCPSRCWPSSEASGAVNQVSDTLPCVFKLARKSGWCLWLEWSARLRQGNEGLVVCTRLGHSDYMVTWGLFWKRWGCPRLWANIRPRRVMHKTSVAVLLGVQSTWLWIWIGTASLLILAKPPR